VNAPDPTADGKSASAASDQPVTKKSAPRGAGQPEAPPVKGQPDYSHPNPSLPPSVQDLLNGLTHSQGGHAAPATPNVPPVKVPDLPPGVDPSTALNYLLGP
jgi:hypothetical protein